MAVDAATARILTVGGLGPTMCCCSRLPPAWPPGGAPGPKVAGLPHLSVVQIPHAPVQQLAQTVDRRVSAQVMVMEGQVTMTVGGVDVTLTPEPLQ